NAGGASLAGSHSEAGNSPSNTGAVSGGDNNTGGNDPGTATGGAPFGGANHTGGKPETSMGGAVSGGTNNNAGNNSGTNTSGSTFGGSSNGGGNHPGTGSGGHAIGGANIVGGNNSGTSTGGYAIGGAGAVGGTNPGTYTGGSSGGGSLSTGGIAGYALGGTSGGYNAGGPSRSGSSGAPSGGSTQAAPAVLSDCCRYANLVIIEGVDAGDTLLSQSLASALSGACGNATTTRQVSQDAPGVLDASGRPLIGPMELILMSGGFVTQKAVAYLDQNDTPVYASFTARKNRYSAFTRAGAQVFSIRTDAFTASYDVAIIAVTYEPISQSFVIDIYGSNSAGTQAGTFYFANTLAPNLQTDSHHYYVVEWTDQDGDQAASAGDRYVLLTSG
ncbi:MAG TPA: hypothetical protein VIV60_13340, partial [Polyangiaceae bacterium]